MVRGRQITRPARRAAISKVAGLLSAAWFAFGWTAPVRAEIDGIVSYNLGISESGMLAKSPHDMMTAMMAGWHTQDDLTAARSKPNFYLTNNSDTAVISEIVLSIGDLAYHFAEITLLEGYANLTFEVEYTPGRDKAVITFNQKFKPGRSILFQTAIRPDSANAFQFPNYQSVLFDVNGASDADNAKLKISFQDPQATETLTLAARLPDFQVAGYTPRPTPGLDEYYELQTVLGFELDDVAFPSVETVPEPDSVVIALVGAALTVLQIRRQSRRPT